MTAAATMSRTTSPGAYPMARKFGTPVKSRPESASSTVPPAKTTDWPAVAVASAAASGTDRPRASASRCRVTMNNA